MPVVATAPENAYVPAPVGLHAAVCVDVIDLGMIEEQWGDDDPKKKHKIAVTWEIEEIHPNFGDPFRVTKRYSLSLHKRASLYKDLIAWRGVAFTDEELAGFDVENVLGAPCALNIVHNVSGDKTYANVASISPLSKGMARLTPSSGYERVMDRPGGWDVRSPEALDPDADEEADGGQAAIDKKAEEDLANLPF